MLDPKRPIREADMALLRLVRPGRERPVRGGNVCFRPSDLTGRKRAINDADDALGPEVQGDFTSKVDW